MKTAKTIFAVAVLFIVGLSTSCTKDSASDDNTIYEQAIDGNEIKEQDM